MLDLIWEDKMRNIIKIFYLLICICLLIISLSIPVNELNAAEIDQVLLDGTIERVKSLVGPGYDVHVSYNKKKRLVYVKFRAPTPKKINYARIWETWRDNQWVALQMFKKANIPVDYVTVETNYPDGSAIVRVTHLAKHIDKYGKRFNDDLWHRTGKFYQKTKGDTEWHKID